jgi:hypothetical protein
MKTMKISLFALALPLLAAACAAESGSDASPTDDADLRADGITKLTISGHAGFVPPTPLGACIFGGTGSFAVDFAAKTVKGDACLDGGKRVSADRTITNAEAAAVRAAVRNVKTTKAPENCPLDIGGHFLGITRGTRESRFVDPLSACHASAQAAEGLPELLAAVAKLAAPSEQTAQGKLTSHFAIGGETTGMAIETESGVFELDFAPGHPAATSFVPDRKAIVVGPIVSRTGVEIPKRDVLLVTDMLVCPASSAVLNCQPPNESRVCAFPNRLWIANNCDGVTFLD